MGGLGGLYTCLLSWQRRNSRSISAHDWNYRLKNWIRIKAKIRIRVRISITTTDDLVPRACLFAGYSWRAGLLWERDWITEQTTYL